MPQRQRNDGRNRASDTPKVFWRGLIASQLALLAMFGLFIGLSLAEDSMGMVAALGVVYGAFALFSVFVFSRTRQIDWNTMPQASEAERRARLTQALGGRWVITLFSVGVTGLFLAVWWLVEG